MVESPAMALSSSTAAAGWCTGPCESDLRWRWRNSRCTAAGGPSIMSCSAHELLRSSAVSSSSAYHARALGEVALHRAFSGQLRRPLFCLSEASGLRSVPSKERGDIAIRSVRFPYVTHRRNLSRSNVLAFSSSKSTSSEPKTVPVAVWLVTSTVGAVAAGFRFLFEQPSQLRYIEWPSFTTLVRMALLTLIVVTCLIVLLATVDSTMSYVLACFLRRVP